MMQREEQEYESYNIRGNIWIREFHKLYLYHLHVSKDSLVWT